MFNIGKEAPVFAHEYLQQAPNTQPTEHFQPIKGPKDQFGNVIFSSPSLAYYDKNLKETKAALLVSESGQRLIKNHSGLLQSIDQGLRHLSYGLPSRFKQQVDLKSGGTLERYLSGDLSQVFLCRLEGQKLIVKIPVSGKSRKKILSIQNPPSQPYIDEMLQIQTLADTFQEELQTAKMRFPNFFFTSSHVLCQEFIEKASSPESSFDLNSRRLQLLETMQTYVYSNSNSLWQGIMTDWTSQLSEMTKIYKPNCIEEPGGFLVLVDPFFFQSKK